ncbi:unnamed protein product [Phytophthora lilii]|uniref:Unnamed protein product n=1 Tax=Phytophthora lilii TaxID=2077276 RepID=A0A9W6TDH2_9STRA|nr:unnamed protein product [Phytophthora lilii]
MTSDVASNSGFGADAMLEDWRFYSNHHDNLEIRLGSLEKRAEGLIIAFVKIYTTITERMLLNSLPQLTNAKNEAKESSAWKLISQTLVVPTTVKFQWDDARDQFVSAYYEADMLTPLLRLLGNWEIASRVLSSSLGIPTFAK